MKARLQRTTKGKGSLTIYFTNEEQLQALYERLVGSAPSYGANGSGSSNGSAAYDFDSGSLDSLGDLLDDGMPFDGDPEAEN
jgi:hypothetical protein